MYIETNLLISPTMHCAATYSILLILLIKDTVNRGRLFIKDKTNKNKIHFPGSISQ